MLGWNSSSTGIPLMLSPPLPVPSYKKRRNKYLSDLLPE